MPNIKLKFKSASTIVGFAHGGLIVLVDEDETRQLSITCDKNMLYQFGVRLDASVNTDNYLPEALCSFLGLEDGEHNFELLIYGIYDGQYKVLLTDNATSRSVKIRASDAILLSLIAKIPLYITDVVMERQSTAYKSDGCKMSLPLNSITDEMLDLALQKAVKEEKYELASHLRDEKIKREHNHNNADRNGNK